MKTLGKIYQKHLAKVEEKKALGKRPGFDGLIVTVCLILLVMILIVLFRNTVMESVTDSINQTADEIDDLTGAAVNNGPTKNPTP